MGFRQFVVCFQSLVLFSGPAPQQLRLIIRSSVAPAAHMAPLFSGTTSPAAAMLDSLDHPPPPPPTHTHTHTHTHISPAAAMLHSLEIVIVLVSHCALIFSSLCFNVELVLLFCFCACCAYMMFSLCFNLVREGTRERSRAPLQGP